MTGNQAALPCRWFPVVRHDRSDETTGTWMQALTQPPKVVGCGVDFALQVMRGRHAHTLRERIGVPPNTLVLVHGQVRSQALQKVWDARSELVPWAKGEGVDGFITPQFVTGKEEPDLPRYFEWYRQVVEEEFAFPVFQHLGSQPKKTRSLLQECYDFAKAEKVPMVAISVGRDRGRGGLLPLTVRDHRLCRENYPPKVCFIHFGVSTLLRMRMAAKLLGALDGEHPIAFTNVTASASAAFYLRVPQHITAPGSWSKGQTFAANVRAYEEMADRVLGQKRQARPNRRRPRKR